MQTMVDKTRHPVQSCDRRAGRARSIGAGGLIRSLAATLVAVVLTEGVAWCQTSSEPPTSGSQSKPAPSKTSKKASAPASEQPEGSQKQSLIAMSMEEMLATALKDNPDIRVAEAKLREAETELNRVRLDVAQKVSIFRKDWEVHQARIAEYETRFQEAEKLMSSKAISHEEYRLTQVNVQVNRALLAKLEAELPYLLGRGPRAVPPSHTQSPEVKVYALQHASANGMDRVLRDLLGGQKSAVSVGVDDRSNTLIVSAPPETQAMIEALIRKLDGGDQRLPGRPRARSEMEEKILKALNTPIEASFQDKPLDDLLKDFRKSFGIPFVADPASFGGTQGIYAGDPNPKVTLDLGEVPLAIVLQAIQDTAHVYFTVREYGIHVSVRQQEAAGAVEFWKRERQSGEKPQER